MGLIDNVLISAKALKNAVIKAQDTKDTTKDKEKENKDTEQKDNNSEEDKNAYVKDGKLTATAKKDFQNWLNRVEKKGTELVNKIKKSVEPISNIANLLVTGNVQRYYDNTQKYIKEKEAEKKSKEIVNIDNIDTSTKEGAENYFTMKNFFDQEAEDNKNTEYYRLGFDKKDKDKLEQGIAYTKGGEKVYISDGDRTFGTKLDELGESIKPNWGEGFMNMGIINTDVKDVVTNAVTKQGVTQFLKDLSKTAAPLLDLKQEEGESEEEYGKRFIASVDKAKEEFEDKYATAFGKVTDVDGDKYNAGDFISMYLSAYKDYLDNPSEYREQHKDDSVLDQAALKSLFKTNAIHYKLGLPMVTTEDYININAQDANELNRMMLEGLKQVVQKRDLGHLENLVELIDKQDKITNTSEGNYIKSAIGYINGDLNLRKDEDVDVTKELLNKMAVKFYAYTFALARTNNPENLQQVDMVNIEDIIEAVNKAEGKEKERLQKLLNYVFAYKNKGVSDLPIASQFKTKHKYDNPGMFANSSQQMSYNDLKDILKDEKAVIDYYLATRKIIKDDPNADSTLPTKYVLNDIVDGYKDYGFIDQDEEDKYLKIVNEILSQDYNIDKTTKDGFRKYISDKLSEYLGEPDEQLVDYVAMMASDGKYIYGKDYKDIPLTTFFENFLQIEGIDGKIDEFRTWFGHSFDVGNKNLTWAYNAIKGYDNDKTVLTNQILQEKAGEYSDQLDNFLTIVQTFEKDPLTYAGPVLGKIGNIIGKGFGGLIGKLLPNTVNKQKTLQVISQAENGIKNITKLASKSNRSNYVITSFLENAVDEIVTNTAFALLQEPDYGIQDLAFDLTTGWISSIGRGIGIIKELHRDKTIGKAELLLRRHLQYNLKKSEEEIETILKGLGDTGIAKYADKLETTILEFAKDSPDELNAETIKGFFDNMGKDAGVVWNKFIEDTQKEFGKVYGGMNQAALKTLGDIGSSLVQKVIVNGKVKYQWKPQNGKTKTQIQREGIQKFLKGDYNHDIKSSNLRDEEVEKYVNSQKLLSSTSSGRKKIKKKMEERVKKQQENSKKQTDNKALSSNKKGEKGNTKKRRKSKEEETKELMIFEIYQRGKQGQNFLKILQLLGISINTLDSKAISALRDAVNRTEGLVKNFSDVAATFEDHAKEISDLLKKGDYKSVTNLLEENGSDVYLRLALIQGDYNRVLKMLGLTSKVIDKQTFRKLYYVSRTTDELIDIISKWVMLSDLQDERGIKLSGKISQVKKLFLKKHFKEFDTINIDGNVLKLKFDKEKNILQAITKSNNVLYTIDKDGNIVDTKGNKVNSNNILIYSQKKIGNTKEGVLADKFKDYEDLNKFLKQLQKHFPTFIIGSNFFLNDNLYDILDKGGLFEALNKTELGKAILDNFYADINKILLYGVGEKNVIGDITYALKEMGLVYKMVTLFDHKYKYNKLSANEKIELAKQVIDNKTNIIKEMKDNGIESDNVIDMMDYLSLKEYGMDIIGDNSQKARTKNVSKKLFEVTEADPNKPDDYARIITLEQYANKVLGYSKEDLENAINKQPYVFKSMFVTLGKVIDNLNNKITLLEEEQKQNIQPTKQATPYRWRSKKKFSRGIGQQVNVLINEQIEALKIERSQLIKGVHNKKIDEIDAKIDQYSEALSTSKYPFKHYESISDRYFVKGAWEVDIVASNKWNKHQMEFAQFREKLESRIKERGFKKVAFYSVDEDGKVRVKYIEGNTVTYEGDQALKAISEYANEGVTVEQLRAINGFFNPDTDTVVINMGTPKYSYQGGPKLTTISHEWFHRSLQFMFTKEERFEIQKLFDQTYDAHFKEITENAISKGYDKTWREGTVVDESELSQEDLVEYHRYITEEWLADQYAIYENGKLDKSRGGPLIKFFQTLWIRIRLMFDKSIRDDITSLFHEVYTRKDPVTDIQINGGTKFMLPEDRKTADKLTNTKGMKKNGIEYKYELGALWSKQNSDSDWVLVDEGDKEADYLFKNPHNVYGLLTLGLGEISSFKEIDINGNKTTLDQYTAQYNDKMQEDEATIINGLKDLQNNHFDDQTYTIQLNNGDNIVLVKNIDGLFEYQFKDMNSNTINSMVINLYKGTTPSDSKVFGEIANNMLFMKMASGQGSLKTLPEILYKTYLTKDFRGTNQFIRSLAFKSEMVNYWNTQAKGDSSLYFQFDEEAKAIDSLYALQRYNLAMTNIKGVIGHRGTGRTLYNELKKYRDKQLMEIINNKNKYKHITITKTIDNTAKVNKNVINFYIPFDNGINLLFSFHLGTLLEGIELDNNPSKNIQNYKTLIHPLALQSTRESLTNVSYNYDKHNDGVIRKKQSDNGKLSQIKYSLQDKYVDAAIVQERLGLNKTVSEFDKVIGDEYKSIKKEYTNGDVSNGNTKFSLAENGDDVYKTLNGVEIIRKPDEGFVMTTTFGNPAVIDALIYNGYSLQHSVGIKDDIEYDESQDYLGSNALIFSNKNKQGEFGKGMIEKLIVGGGDLGSICAGHALLKIVYDDIVNEANRILNEGKLFNVEGNNSNSIKSIIQQLLTPEKFQELIVNKYKQDTFDITANILKDEEDTINELRETYIEYKMSSSKELEEYKKELYEQLINREGIFKGSDEESANKKYDTLVRLKERNINNSNKTKEELGKEFDDKVKEGKILKVYQGNVYTEDIEKLKKKISRKHNPVEKVKSDGKGGSMGESSLLFVMQKAFGEGQPIQNLYKHVGFRDLRRYFEWIDWNKVKDRIGSKENYVEYLKDMLGNMSPNKSFESIASSFYWDMSKEDYQGMFISKLLEDDPMTSIGFPEYIDNYNKTKQEYINNMVEYNKAGQPYGGYPNASRIFYKYINSDKMLAAFILYKLSGRISGFKIQDVNQMPLSVSRDYYDSFPKPLYYTDKTFSDEEYQEAKKGGHIMIDTSWKSESPEAKMYGAFFKAIQNIVLDDIFEIYDSNGLVDLTKVIQKCTEIFDENDLINNDKVGDVYKKFKNLSPIEQQEFILPFFIKRMEFEKNPYIEGWGYTLDMEDLKFVVTDDNSLTKDRKTKMQDAGYDVHDLTHIQGDIQERFEELNKGTDTKFIINWKQSKQTPRLRFSLSDDKEYNIVTDTNDQIKHLGSLAYPNIYGDIYYINNTLTGKPLSIFDLTTEQYKKQKDILPKGTKIINKGFDKQDIIDDFIYKGTNNFCVVNNHINDADMIDIERYTIKPDYIRDHNGTLMELEQKQNLIAKNNGLKYPKIDDQILKQNNNRDGISKQINILNNNNDRIIRIRDTKMKIDGLKNTVDNIIKRPIFKFSIDTINELGDNRIKTLIEDGIKDHNNQNILFQEGIEKPINIDNKGFGDVPPIGILDKRYGDISQMQEITPQIEKDLVKIYGNFEIIPYTKDSLMDKIENKGNFVLWSNDGYTFWKTTNDIKRLYPEYEMVYQRDNGNVIYYKRNEDISKQEVHDIKKKSVDMQEDISQCTMVCSI